MFGDVRNAYMKKDENIGEKKIPKEKTQTKGNKGKDVQEEGQ